MNGNSTSRIKVVAVGSAVVALAVILLFLSRSWQQTIPIRAAQASYQDLIEVVSTAGKVEPMSEFQAHASAPGIVEKVYVDLNQKVRAGQLLVSMQDEDASARLANSRASLSSAEAFQQDLEHGGTQDERNNFQADLGRAQNQLQDANRSLASVQALEKTGSASPAEVEQQQQRVRGAQANIDAIHVRMGHRYTPADLAHAKAQVADAQAAVRAASAAIANEQIRSPISGTVYSRSIAPYDYVPAGDELLKVADLKRLRIRAYFDEPDIGKLAAGQPVSIKWEAKYGKVWHGHVDVAPTTVIAYGTRNVGEALITVDDADGELKPYANVTVTVTTSQLHHVLVIPHEALRTQGGVNFVFIVRDGRLVRTPVQVGMSNYTLVQVTGGLSPGDTVALGATTNRDLSADLRVAPVDEAHE